MYRVHRGFIISDEARPTIDLAECIDVGPAITCESRETGLINHFLCEKLWTSAVNDKNAQYIINVFSGAGDRHLPVMIRAEQQQ